MNEELKIIIKAVTEDAKKGIQGVNKELKGMEGSAGKGGKAMAMLGKAAKVAVAAVAAVGAAVVGVIAALTNASAKTEEYRKSMAQLTSAFQANGSSAAQAKKTYGELFRFMGETDTAVEASNLLSQLTTDEKNLAQWTKTLQGVYATFPDSLPIESLVEASNETARVGKVTGTLADSLNWAGVSEDEFNAKLAQTNTLAEREALIRETLSGLYNDAAELYEENAAKLLAQNEAQNRLNETLARVGEAAQPLQTALTNLSATLLNALAPAIEAIVPHLVNLINWVSKAVNWVLSLINALTGSNKAVKATQEVANSVKTVGTTANNAAKGAGAITDGLDDATKAAEKLKRTTAGFDELNVLSSGTSSGGSSGGSGAAAPAYTGATGGAIGGGAVDFGLTDAFDTTSDGATKFAEKLKGIFNDIKNAVLGYASLFQPTFDAWGAAFSGLNEPVTNAFGSIKETFGTMMNETLIPFGSYIFEDFVPTIVNSFSENLAPVFSDVLGFAVTEFATHFEWAAGVWNNVINDMLQPSLEFLKTITTDTFEVVGNEWDKSGSTLMEKFSGFTESIRTIWDNLYSKVLKPVWDVILGALNNIWKESLKPLLEKVLSFASKLGECVMTIWNNFLAPIVNWLITVLAPIVVNVVDSIMSVVRTLFKIVKDVVGGVLDALGGVLDFLTGLFTLNFKKMWEGIKAIFKGVWDAIWGIAKGIINLIIDAINNLWSGIYSVISGLVNGIGSIAGAIGDLLGKNWKFEMPQKAPRIPKLATGGIVNSATIAMIGEQGKEAVLPLENNTGWIDMLVDKLAARNNTPSKIVLMLDGKELGHAAINSINNITRQTGALQLAIV